MIPLERLAFEYEQDDQAEYGQRDNLLDDFELNEREGTAGARTMRMS